MKSIKDSTWTEIIAYGAGVLTVAGAILCLEAWLLLVVLGWFGIHALAFWQAVVTVLLVSALFGGSRK
jgi:hypothetical protein